MTPELGKSDWNEGQLSELPPVNEAELCRLYGPVLGQVVADRARLWRLGRLDSRGTSQRQPRKTVEFSPSIATQDIKEIMEKDGF